MWISEKIDKGQIVAKRAAKHSGGPEAAIDWLRTYWLDLPKTLRPDKEDIDEFGAFFSTYLLSSFDVVLKPGTRGTESSAGFCDCRCPVCVRIVNASHLRPKKLYAADKRRATNLMFECVSAMASELALNVNESAIEQLVRDSRIRRSAAYLTYGYWSIERLEGRSAGAAILVLWRLIAWDPRGAPRPNFVLALKDFQAAEESLIIRLRELHNQSNTR